MPRRKPLKTFYLVIADHDKGTFTVEGPLTDDTLWNKAVCDAQEDGRQVNCYTSGMPTRQETIDGHISAFGGTLVDRGSIARPSPW